MRGGCVVLCVIVTVYTAAEVDTGVPKKQNKKGGSQQDREQSCSRDTQDKIYELLVNFFDSVLVEFI